MTQGIVTPEIDITVQDARWKAAFDDVIELCDVTARAAFNASSIRPPRTEVSLVLADDEFVAGLNKQYRDHEGPTNVLSFAAHEGVDNLMDMPDGMPVMLGDIIIAYDTTAREARQSGASFEDHFRHLVVHGMLHLLDYDHISDEDAAIMEPLETLVLAKLGICDPYNGGAGRILDHDMERNNA